MSAAAPEPPGGALLGAPFEGRARWTRRTRRRTFAADHPALSVALAALALLSFAAIAAPLLVGDPLEQSPADQFQSPSLAHLFGTDELGRDIFSRVVHGGQVSLLTAAVSTLIATVVGVPLGLVAGYFGRMWDASIMRLVDFLLAVPAVIVAMAFIAVLGQSTTNVIVAIGIVGIPSIARLARAGTLSVKQQDFVLVARAVGASRSHLLFRTILPNVAGPLLAQMAVLAETAVLLQAALSFLGLGTPPPAPTWGGMLSDSQAYLSQAAWYGVFPGIALTITALSLDTVARGVQDLLQGGDR